MNIRVHPGCLVYNGGKKGGIDTLLVSKHQAELLLESIEISIIEHKIKKHELAERLGYNRKTIYTWFQDPERHYRKLLLVQKKIKEGWDNGETIRRT